MRAGPLADQARTKRPAWPCTASVRVILLRTIRVAARAGFTPRGWSRLRPVSRLVSAKVMTRQRMTRCSCLFAIDCLIPKLAGAFGSGAARPASAPASRDSSGNATHEQ